MSNETVFVAVVVAGVLIVVLNVFMFYILLRLAYRFERQIHSVFESLSSVIMNTHEIERVLSDINRRFESREDDGR